MTTLIEQAQKDIDGIQQERATLHARFLAALNERERVRARLREGDATPTERASLAALDFEIGDLDTRLNDAGADGFDARLQRAGAALDALYRKRAALQEEVATRRNAADIGMREKARAAVDAVDAMRPFLQSAGYADTQQGRGVLAIALYARRKIEALDALPALERQLEALG